MTKRLLEYSAALSSFVAAIFWFLSAQTPVPQMHSYWGYTPAGDAFYQAFVQGVADSRDAAAFACIAALLWAAATATEMASAPQLWRRALFYLLAVGSPIVLLVWLLLRL